MNLKHLPDDTLILETEKLVNKERELLTSILHHLYEIERRRLYSAHGCSSLFAYAVQKLRYSESQAYRRINAMRMLKSMPEVESQISSGALNLSHLNLVGSLKVDVAEKRQVLEKIANTSAREAERIVLSLHPGAVPAVQEKVRAVSAELSEYRFLAPAGLAEKLERLKGLLGHSNPKITTAELIDKLCDLGLERWDPAKKPVRTRKSQPSTLNKRRVGRVTMREVWKKAESRCENCGGHHALQVDHIRPLALGGDSGPGNLRLLCRQCNQRAAIEKLGLSKMQSFFSQGQKQ